VISSLVGLCGVLIAAMTSEFNEPGHPSHSPTSAARSEISHDSGTWIESLYVSGRDHRHGDLALLLMTFTFKALDAFCDRAVRRLERADPVQPNIAAIYALRLLQGSLEADHPLLMTTLSGSHAEHPALRLAVYALTATSRPRWPQRWPRFGTDVVDWRFVFLQTIPSALSPAFSSGTAASG